MLVATSMSSCQEDENWQPTWAMPVVKETSLTVGDFVAEEDVAEFNVKIKEFWDDYVNDQRAAYGDVAGDQNVDSVAYSVLTDTTLNYVTHPTDGTTPQLTPEAIAENNLTPDQVDQINQFLEDYFRLLYPTVNPTSRSAGVKRVVRPMAAASGGQSAIDNLLDGIASNPPSVFPTVATLMNIMPDKIDSINAQLDEVLKKANMNDLFDLNLRDLVKDAQGVTYLKIDMDMENTLPFRVSFHANFVDAAGDSIRSLFSDNLNQSASKPLPSFYLDNSNGARDLQKIINQTNGVRLKVDLTKAGELNAEQIKELANKGIKFDLRVRIKAQMNDLINGF